MKKFLCMLLAGCLFLTFHNSSLMTNAKEAADVPEQLYARSAVLMDADSGRVLFGKEESVIRPMASTTKIMTCILALENMENDQLVTVSENAARQPKVRLGVKEKEEYLLRDLLYSLMLESHNDSAVVIAEGIGGTVAGFADMMNEKAQQLGCDDTYFITPNGLDAKDDKGVHATTAEDLAKIMRYCIKESPKKEEFLQITQTQTYSFANADGRTFSCNNHNAFLSMMEGALSGKTGFTGDAGYCYVGALEKDGRTFIVALLACGWPNNKGYKWTDTKKLMNYGLENYHYQKVWKPLEFDDITVIDGLNKKISLKIKDPDETWQMLLRKGESLDITWDIKEQINAPVKNEEKAGEVTYLLNGEKVKTFDVVTDGRVEARDLRWCLQYVMKKLCL